MGIRNITWFLIGFSAFGCKHKPQEIPAPTCTQVLFSQQVKPIIQQNCATYGCHTSGSADGDFNNFADLKEKVTNGSFHNSVIKWNVPKMPETYKLPEDQIQILRCWIEQGANNN